MHAIQGVHIKYVKKYNPHLSLARADEIATF